MGGFMKPVTVNVRTFPSLPTMTNIAGPKLVVMYFVACVAPFASMPSFPVITYILVTQMWIVLEAAIIAAKAPSSLCPISALHDKQFIKRRIA